MRRTTLAITLISAFCAGGLLAQSAPDPSTADQVLLSQKPTTREATAEDASPTEHPMQNLSEAPALDGSGPISMSLINKPHLLVGGTVSGGFDSDPLNLGTSAATATYSFSPYVGVQGGNARTQVIVQYHPTISRFTSYAGQSIHLASAKVASSFSPRLEWTVGITGSYGDDSLRLLEPTRASTGNGDPASGAGSASFLPNSGTATNLDGGVDLHYAASPRSTLALHLADSYNSLPALHHKGSVATTDLNYTRSVNSMLSLLVYGENAYYYGDLTCNAVGAGIGVRWQPVESTTISAKAGPQIDSPGCKSQQGFSYNTSVVRKLPWRSQFYVTADRQPVISYLGSGLWQDDVSAGYERRLQAANTLSFDAGFIHSSTLVDAASYRGTFFDSSYVRDIHKGLSLRWTYRIFNGRSGETDINRNVLQFGLTYTPNTRTPN